MGVNANCGRAVLKPLPVTYASFFSFIGTTVRCTALFLRGLPEWPAYAVVLTRLVADNAKTNIEIVMRTPVFFRSRRTREVTKLLHSSGAPRRCRPTI